MTEPLTSEQLDEIAVRQLQAENEQLRKDTENSVKVNRATITGLRDEAANLTAECAALREQLASSEAQRDTDSAKAIKVLELFALAREQLASSEGRVDRLTSQLEGVMNCLATSQQELEAARGEVNQRDVNRVAANPTEATEQTWCDHCSADLNGVRHILCERCYREYAAAPPALAAAQCGAFKPSILGVPEPEDRCVKPKGHTGKHSRAAATLAAAQPEKGE